MRAVGHFNELLLHMYQPNSFVICTSKTAINSESPYRWISLKIVRQCPVTPPFVVTRQLTPQICWVVLGLYERTNIQNWLTMPLYLLFVTIDGGWKRFATRPYGFKRIDPIYRLYVKPIMRRTNYELLQFDLEGNVGQNNIQERYHIVQIKEFRFFQESQGHEHDPIQGRCLGRATNPSLQWQSARSRRRNPSNIQRGQLVCGSCSFFGPEEINPKVDMV